MTDGPATPEELLVVLAARYDDEDGRLGESVVRRLHARQARSGKVCGRCDERKPLSAFSRDSTREEGLRRYCRDCDAISYRSRVNAGFRPPVALFYSEGESLQPEDGQTKPLT